MYALVDCNNFYCSCERVFNPKLEGRPVIVLSNNDGCAISRSDEAKALGIAMAAPVFMMQKLIDRHGVAIFSSNYTLYGDMSSRIMDTLGSFVPKIEMYSIDEAFLDLGEMLGTDLLQLALTIRKTVRRNSGFRFLSVSGLRKRWQKWPTAMLENIINRPRYFGHRIQPLLRRYCVPVRWRISVVSVISMRFFYPAPDLRRLRILCVRRKTG